MFESKDVKELLGVGATIFEVMEKLFGLFEGKSPGGLELGESGGGFYRSFVDGGWCERVLDGHRLGGVVVRIRDISIDLKGI